jgi:hypothetical protein
MCFRFLLDGDAVSISPRSTIAIHTPTLTEDGQYWITSPAAVTSDAVNIENEYQ